MEELPKKKFGIVVFWWKIFVLKIGPELMAVDEANNQRILEQKIESQLYSTAGTWSSTLLHKVSKILY